MRYIVNKYSDDKGRHEVHAETCSYLPSKENQIEIGNFFNCKAAILAAKLKWQDPEYKFDGCYYCCNQCHKG
ncbi:hypothetical protein ACKA04_04635 [Helcococcus kunzii]|uniref:hypothetical protein n=1 Tax=Helcococcus kunzii TaxID=40091 RepID=UPI0038A8EFA3